jgi:polyhydroxyalkanoate synthase
MLNFANNQYQQYLDDYFNYLGGEKEKPLYKTMADSAVGHSDLIQIFKYKSSNSPAGRSFLVIPSIFNSPEILFLGKDKGLVGKLMLEGDVYLVNWLESSAQRTINEYILELSAVVNILAADTPKINLIGHCLGGNIAIGVGCLNREKISSITLLTTPWDYSHFNNAIALHKLFGLDSVIKKLDIVPKVYIQIMFFLLFPDQFCQKIAKYSDLKSFEFKEIYMKVEDWLQSGIDIPKSIYLQIIDDLASKNMFYSNRWRINEEKVNLSDIDYPVCIISAKEDRIAPLSSILPLHRSLKNSTLIEVDGGHISYLLNSDQKFNDSYSDWLKEKKPSLRAKRGSLRMVEALKS